METRLEAAVREGTSMRMNISETRTAEDDNATVPSFIRVAIN